MRRTAKEMTHAPTRTHRRAAALIIPGTLGGPALAADDPGTGGAAEIARLEKPIAQADVELARIQLEIDSIEAWISDPQAGLVVVGDDLLAVDLTRVEAYLPIATRILERNPMISDEAIRRLPAELAALIVILPLMPTESSAAAIRERRRMEPEKKAAIAAPFPDALDRERAELDGIIDGLNAKLDTLEGSWIEDHSGLKCGSEKDGSRNWGRLTLTFDETFSTYNGRFTWCETPLDGGWGEGDWISPRE